MLDRVVSGRDLHRFLEVGTAYKDWFLRMVSYGFIEDQDISSIVCESTGGRPSMASLKGQDCTDILTGLWSLHIAWVKSARPSLEI